ncbi:unnamed protein product, partial [Heterosigma akashiwo]
FPAEGPAPAAAGGRAAVVGGETRNYDDGNKQLEGVVGIGGSLLEENDSETASITSKPNKKRLKKGSTSFK